MSNLKKKNGNKPLRVCKAIITLKNDTKFEIEFIKYFAKKKCNNFITTSLIGVSVPDSICKNILFEEIDKKIEEIEEKINENICA